MILFKIILLQLIVIVIVIFILKAVFERELFLMAIEQLGRRDVCADGDPDKVIVLTAKEMPPELEAKVRTAVKVRFPGAAIEQVINKDILGGIVIKTDKVLIDMSLLSRMKNLSGKQDA